MSNLAANEPTAERDEWLRVAGVEIVLWEDLHAGFWWRPARAWPWRKWGPFPTRRACLDAAGTMLRTLGYRAPDQQGVTRTGGGRCQRH